MTGAGGDNWSDRLGERGAPRWRGGRQRRGGPPWRGGRQWHGGPPWRGGLAWRGGRGPHGGPGPRGFGCFFAFFLLVLGSAALVVVSVVASLAGLLVGGPPPGVLPFAAFVVLLVGSLVIVTAGRVMRGAAGTLDDLLDATRRVERGDYATRVEPRRGPRPLRELANGFNTMVGRLDADERQRRTLLADVSHELRTPLAVIQGNLEGLVDGVYPADQEHLAPILDETRVLGRLIDDLRTLALSDAGTLALHREPTDLAVLVEDALATFRPAADGAGVALVADVDEGLPLLDVDPVRIREVLSNLVANALRYTPGGGSIAVAARRVVEPPGVVVEVADTGPGIPPDLLPHLFERFTKSAESRGSGLGLAIARSLVEAHGGSIAVRNGGSGGGREASPVGAGERGEGRGTTIVIMLPA